MRAITITITALVSDDAEIEQIDHVAGAAMVQVLEPTDEEGEDMPWTTETASVQVTVGPRDGR